MQREWLARMVCRYSRVRAAIYSDEYLLLLMPRGTELFEIINTDFTMSVCKFGRLLMVIEVDCRSHWNIAINNAYCWYILQFTL